MQTKYQSSDVAPNRHGHEPRGMSLPIKRAS
jgi:hypothetical protein